MASTQAIWGIDVGRCALKALKLRLAADGKVEIVAKDYIEHAKILSQPDADRNELISRALETFLSRNDISKDEVVVSVPGQHTLARFTKLPPVAPKRIPDIVRYEADQQIPFDMDEVIWDYQTFQQEGSPDLEVGIFAMKRELIREHLLHFEQASIEPIAVQSGPLAAYNAANYDGMLGEETTILLDTGAENTDLIIATQDTFWTRTVPIGGNNFTEALVKSFKLSFSKAENLKRTADSSKYARQIFQAMRPIFADLVQELQRSIGFYSSTHRDTHVDKVVCVGNAFKLPGLQKYLQQNLGLPVEAPDSFKMAIPSSAVDAEFREHVLGLAVAYGLALQGAELAKVSSNLLPAEIAKQVTWRKKRPAFAAAAACLVLAGGLIWFRHTADMRALAAGAEEPRVQVNTVEEASLIIENGPNASSDRRRAEEILAAGDLLKKKLSSFGGRGDEERAEAVQLLQLQRNKAVVPSIFQIIHESVPKDELSEVATQAELNELIADGRVPPRGERIGVSITGLDMHWEDVNAYEWESIAPVPEPINDPDQELLAIKIEITCTTPNQTGPTYIADSFMSELRKNGRRPDTGLYFDRVYLYDARKVEVSDAVAGRDRAMGGTVSPEALDVRTNEPIEDDWQFEIWIDAIPENLPESEVEEAETEEIEGD